MTIMLIMMLCKVLNLYPDLLGLRYDYHAHYNSILTRHENNCLKTYEHCHTDWLSMIEFQCRSNNTCSNYSNTNNRNLMEDLYK